MVREKAPMLGKTFRWTPAPASAKGPASDFECPVALPPGVRSTRLRVGVLSSAGLEAPSGVARRKVVERPRPATGNGRRGVPVLTFGPRTVCTACGIIGADARPNWRENPARDSLTGVQ
jgi:hypothetical protein